MAGQGETGVRAADLLKPALARGDLELELDFLILNSVVFVS